VHAADCPLLLTVLLLLLTVRCSVGQRIKEALPGTKEHKAKKEAEGNVAVYS
jgi:hypothetical protein